MRTVDMTVPMIMPMIMPMVMPVVMPVVVRVVVPMTVPMVMRVIMRVPMTASGVGTAFWLKPFLASLDDQVHGTQHVGQHMVGLDFQMIAFELDLHMPVAQVVGRSHQIKGRAVLGAGRDTQDRLRRCNHPDQGAVGGHQHVATAHHRAARQKNAQMPPSRVGGVKAAFLPHVPVELDGGGAFDQHRREARALSHEFGDGQQGIFGGHRVKLVGQL